MDRWIDGEDPSGQCDMVWGGITTNFYRTPLGERTNLDAKISPKVLLDKWLAIGGSSFQDASCKNGWSKLDLQIMEFFGFIHRDGLAYVLLFVAVRTSNWCLYVLVHWRWRYHYSMHLIARPSYLRLILVTWLSGWYPSDATVRLSHLQQGGFVSSVIKALIKDLLHWWMKYHEMKINKEVKMATPKTRVVQRFSDSSHRFCAVTQVRVIFESLCVISIGKLS